jgi:hypothetical protein
MVELRSKNGFLNLDVIVAIIFCIDSLKIKGSNLTGG